jgi:hypothetical protein
MKNFKIPYEKTTIEFMDITGNDLKEAHLSCLENFNGEPDKKVLSIKDAAMENSHKLTPEEHEQYLGDDNG